MKFQHLNTVDGGMDVSCLAIGSAVKMAGLSREAIFELFDLYIEAGGNCIDTARAYGGGQIEYLVGDYLKSRRNRNRLLISTKCGHPAENGRGRLTKADMQEDLETSLQALGTDRIDIYWLHKDDESTPVEGVIDTLNDMMRSGKIRVFGCSNWHTDRIEAANAYAAKSGQSGFSASQIQWNLAETKEEYFKKYTSVVMDAPSYDWYFQNKMPIFAFSPQAQGFFSKAAASGLDSLSDMLTTCYVNPGNLKRLAKVTELAKARRVPVSVPVLAYLINNKLPCVAVFGATSKEMLLETLQAVDFKMSAEEADALFLSGSVM